MRTSPDVHSPVHPNALVDEVADLDYPIGDELPFRDYLRILSRRRWMILSIVALGVATAAVINWTATPIYQAQATLQFDIDMNILGVDRPLLPLDQRDWMREFVPTQIAIIESRDVAVRAHEDLQRSAAGKAPASERSSGVTSTTTSGPSNAPLRVVPSVQQIMGGRTVAL